MNQPLDPSADALPLPPGAAAQPPPEQQAAEAESSGAGVAGDVLGAAAEVVSDAATEGVVDVVGDAIGGLFSIFD